MTVHNEQAVIRYVVTDLDEYASALADVARAVAMRDRDGAAAHLLRLDVSDPHTADAIADFLLFQACVREATR